MNWILYASMIAGLAAIVLSAAMIFGRPKPEKGLYTFKETGANLFLSALCLVSGYFVIIARLMDDKIGGTGNGGLFLCAAFGIALILMACWLAMIALVKQTVVYKEDVLTVSAFGKEKRHAWSDLVRIEKPALTKASKFIFAGGQSFTIQATSKAYKPFMDFARAKLKGRQGKELLKQAEKAMSRV